MVPRNSSTMALAVASDQAGQFSPRRLAWWRMALVICSRSLSEMVARRAETWASRVLAARFCLPK